MKLIYFLIFILEKSKAEEDRRVEELKDKLEHAVATRQEAEAKLIQAETTIKEFMSNSGIVNILILYNYYTVKSPLTNTSQ